MAKFKNIKIKKKGGGSRMQRVQVLKSGKFKFVKNVKKSSSRKSSKKKPKKRKATTKKKTTQKRRVKTMTKNKKRSKSNKLSVTGLFRGSIYALALASPAISVHVNTPGAPLAEKLDIIGKAYTGRNRAGEFSLTTVGQNYGPIVTWTIVDTVLSKFGVWKKMGKMIGNIF